MVGELDRDSGGGRKRKKEPVVAFATTGSFCLVFDIGCLTKFCGLKICRLLSEKENQIDDSGGTPRGAPSGSQGARGRGDGG